MEGPSHEELLASQHEFPGVYRIKAIGDSGNDFAGRVRVAALEGVAGDGAIQMSLRETAGGRHVAVTLDLTVDSPEHVLAIYARLRRLEGLSFLF